jgi:multicomponent Na+:H+ antiporter subunit B
LKTRAVILLGLMGLLLVGAMMTLPPLRSPDNPVAGHVEDYYVSRAMADTATPNLVTAILADYRSYDTFGETTVVFAAGLSCYLLLRRFNE